MILTTVYHFAILVDALDGSGVTNFTSGIASLINNDPYALLGNFNVRYSTEIL